MIARFDMEMVVVGRGATNFSNLNILNTLKCKSLIQSFIPIEFILNIFILNLKIGIQELHCT